VDGVDWQVTEVVKIERGNGGGVRKRGREMAKKDKLENDKTAFGRQ